MYIRFWIHVEFQLHERNQVSCYVFEQFNDNYVPLYTTYAFTSV